MGWGSLTGGLPVLLPHRPAAPGHPRPGEGLAVRAVREGSLLGLALPAFLKRFFEREYLFCPHLVNQKSQPRAPEPALGR